MNDRITLIVDTSEQLPWTFDSTLFNVIRKKLVTGDVSVMGLEDVLSIERKSLGDCVNTVIHGWTRFRRELYRLAAMDHPLMIVEGSVEDILAKKYESDAEPLSVLGRLNSIMIDHGIPVVFAGTRAIAETFAERWLIQTVQKCEG